MIHFCWSSIERSAVYSHKCPKMSHLVFVVHAENDTEGVRRNWGQNSGPSCEQSCEPDHWINEGLFRHTWGKSSTAVKTGHWNTNKSTNLSTNIKIITEKLHFCLLAYSLHCMWLFSGCTLRVAPGIIKHWISNKNNLKTEKKKENKKYQGRNSRRASSEKGGCCVWFCYRWRT